MSVTREPGNDAPLVVSLPISEARDFLKMMRHGGPIAPETMVRLRDEIAALIGDQNDGLAAIQGEPLAYAEKRCVELARENETLRAQYAHVALRAGARPGADLAGEDHERRPTFRDLLNCLSPDELKMLQRLRIMGLGVFDTRTEKAVPQ